MQSRERGESMKPRKRGICLLLALLLTTGGGVAVQASAADGTTVRTSDTTMDSAEQTSATAIEKVQETETESEISGKIEPGERTAVLTVVSITGNELTYYEEETETESESETSGDVSSESETETLTEQVSEQDASSDAQQPSDRPDMSRMPNGTPPGFSQDGTGSDPDMSQIPSGAAPDFSQNENDASGTATKTVYLPVPVVVHTDDGDRTFSILEAGDQLQATIVTDEDGNETITELWLLGTFEGQGKE